MNKRVKFIWARNNVFFWSRERVFSNRYPSVCTHLSFHDVVTWGWGVTTSWKSVRVTGSWEKLSCPEKETCIIPEKETCVTPLRKKPMCPLRKKLMCPLRKKLMCPPEKETYVPP